MRDYLEFIFSSFWVFIGFAFLFCVMLETVAVVAKIVFRKGDK